MKMLDLEATFCEWGNLLKTQKLPFVKPDATFREAVSLKMAFYPQNMGITMWISAAKRLVMHSLALVNN